ncbi:MmgE/PrpD family protein [Rhizobium sullae]|uniref:MmgE/PrpD family protein n=1 Tax=Rhizobium sullae TaxID=50338 RepID=UPI0003F607F4|nr:MmgE/PrpD family protein [Rhizobium sullae]
MIVTELAEFCHATTTAPDAFNAAQKALLDLIGVAAAGASTPAGSASRDAARELWGEGPAGLWFSTRRLPTAGAAFANSTYAAALDLDDGHRGAAGHPGAAIIPAVLSVGETVACNADQLLTAIALGYEVAIRVAASRNIGGLRTTDSGLWCGYGVAAAAAWLQSLPASSIAHAMAIAGQTSTSQSATGWTRSGHTVKEGIPWATANALKAVALAAHGHRGPLDILDEPAQYDHLKLTGRLGRDWTIGQVYFKRYSCCRWAHAAIDAALEIKRTHSLASENIKAITVETFERALTLPNQCEPETNEAAQYSIPFCIALALVHGPVSLLPLDDRHLVDDQVLALSRKVRLTAAEDYSRSFPESTPSRVTLTTSVGQYTQEVITPLGEPANPLLLADLEAKFDHLSHLSPARPGQMQIIKQAIAALDASANLKELFAALEFAL